MYAERFLFLSPRALSSLNFSFLFSIFFFGIKITIKVRASLRARILLLVSDDYFRPLRLVRADHVPDDGPAQRTVAAADAAPLLDRAVVAHAHVAAHVQHRVDRLLEADGAVDAGGAVDGGAVRGQTDGAAAVAGGAGGGVVGS